MTIARVLGKNDWLIVKQKQLGYTICKQTGTLGAEISQGLKISKEWASCSVTVYGNTKEKKQTSLQKNIPEHRESSAYTVALKIVAEAKKEKLKTVLAKAAAHNRATMCRIFRTA